MSSASNLVPTGCGSFEVKITLNRACDIGCDKRDDVTHNGNCPPPLVSDLSPRIRKLTPLDMRTADKDISFFPQPYRWFVGLQPKTGKNRSTVCRELRPYIVYFVEMYLNHGCRTTSSMLIRSSGRYLSII